MKISAKKSAWAAVLVLSKCLGFYYLFYSISWHWVEFKLESTRKGYAAIVYVSILFAEPEFSFTSGR